MFETNIIIKYLSILKIKIINIIEFNEENLLL